MQTTDHVRMDFDSFARWLALAVGLDPASLSRTARIGDVFDSLHVFEALIALEESGIDVPEQLIPHLVTLDDIYGHYSRRVAQKRGRS